MDLVGSGPTLCLYKRVTGADCPGCGMTRSVFSLFHLEFEDAYRFNRGILALAPLLAWLWARELIRNIRLLLTGRRTSVLAA
ncbi:MAG: DUF2752 domain-containing protein [Flavobacteriales bacterium]|nr:DUF2752 domain-containing protein [Flavobacteriales bacterium]